MRIRIVVGTTFEESDLDTDACSCRLTPAVPRFIGEFQAMINSGFRNSFVLLNCIILTFQYCTTYSEPRAR